MSVTVGEVVRKFRVDAILFLMVSVFFFSDAGYGPFARKSWGLKVCRVHHERDKMDKLYAPRSGVSVEVKRAML
jgi:hypothetical protein